MTAPNVGNSFGLGIGDSKGTIDGVRGGTGLERSVVLEVFLDDDSRLSWESSGLELPPSFSKLLE